MTDAQQTTLENTPGEGPPSPPALIIPETAKICLTCKKPFKDLKSLELHYQRLPGHDIRGMLSQKVDATIGENVDTFLDEDLEDGYNKEIMRQLDADTMIAIKELRLERIRARIRALKSPETMQPSGYNQEIAERLGRIDARYDQVLKKLEEYEEDDGEDDNPIMGALMQGFAEKAIGEVKK